MWTFAADYVQGSEQYANYLTAQINSGYQCALVSKYPELMVIKDYCQWEKNAPLLVVQPQSSSSEYDPTGPTLLTPENGKVVRPTEKEIQAVFQGELTGTLKHAYIGQFPQAETSTGAIPVIDIEEPFEDPLYYIPAYLDPLAAFDPSRRTGKPWFIRLKDGELPSFVYWQPKTQAVAEDSRAVRSRAPTPEARATTLEPTSTARTVPAQAPSTPITSSSARAINTEGANDKPHLPIWDWEIFDPRLEEDPVEFLDYYNSCFKGWHGVRQKMMLREEDIHRINYISPCLAHTHKKSDEEVSSDPDVAAAGTSKDAAINVNSVKNVVPSPPSFVRPKNWVQPKPLAADDPAWKAFLDRLDDRSRIRKARIRPEPVFTKKYSNIPGAKIDSKKAVLTREMYEGFYQRARLAQAEIDFRNKCCLACGLKWTKCQTTRHEHYKQHREELQTYTKIIEKRQTILQPEMRVETLDASKVLSPKDVPGLNWFENLERVLLNLENELLEREQTCRVCDKNIDFADEEISDHYREHELERHTLRKVQNVAETTPQSPTVVTTVNGSVQISPQNISPPARSHTKFPPDSPFMARHDKILEQERQKRLALAAKKLAANLVATGKEMERTGTVPTSESVQPVEPTPGSTGEIVDLRHGGPVHSDVVGNTTARLFDFPLSTPTTPTSKTSAQSQDDLEFLFEYDGTRIAPFSERVTTPLVSAMSKLSPSRSTADSPAETSALELIEFYSKLFAIGPKANEEAKRVLKVAAKSPIFGRVPTESIAISSVLIACKRNGLTQSLEEFCSKGRIPARETAKIHQLLENLVSVELPPPSSPTAGEIAAPRKVTGVEDDDSDLYTLPHGDTPVPAEFVIISSDETSSVHSEESEEEIIEAVRTNSGELVPLNDGPVVADAEVIEVDSSDSDSSYPRTWQVEEAILLHIIVGTELSDVLTERLRKAFHRELFDDSKKLTPAQWHETINGSLGKSRIQVSSIVLGAPEDEDISNLKAHGHPLVPIEHDGLDIGSDDLDLDGIFKQAEAEGVGRNQLIILHDIASNICEDMVRRHRENPKIDAPGGIRRWILSKVKKFAEFALEIEIDKSRERAYSKRPIISPRTANYPRRPSQLNSEWSTQAVRNWGPASEQSSKSLGGTSNKRKRPSPLPTSATSRKRTSGRDDDDEFQPGPPTPFNPDEVSPRMPKVPRRNTDLNYRPRSAAFDPTTPPVTPKRSSSQKAAKRAAKRAERRKARKQALKEAVKKAEKKANKSAETKSSKKSDKAGKKAKKVFFHSQEPQVVINKSEKPKKKPEPSTTKPISKATAKATKSAPKRQARNPKRQSQRPSESRLPSQEDQSARLLLKRPSSLARSSMLVERRLMRREREAWN